LLNEIFIINPFTDSIDVVNVLTLGLIYDGVNIDFGVGDSFGADDGLEDLVSLTFTLIIHNTWAINQIYALSQRDVLPDFGLSWNGGDLAHGLAFQGIDDRGFTDIRISNETHTDVLLVFVQNIKLLKKLN
jgi:hypothetical protein